MRFEEKLNLGIASEEIANTENPVDAKPNHRAIFDAIKTLLDMDMDALYDFATSGGYIEEDRVVIHKLPMLLNEQVVSRTVHTGNYTRILEITIDKATPVYKVYIIVKLSVSDDRVNASIQNNMANWKQGDPMPFVYYNTEEMALKAMGDIEDKEAAKAQIPIKPSAKRTPKTSPSPASNVQAAAIQIANKMGKKDVASALQKMSQRQVLDAAKQGKQQAQLDYWKIGKYIFLIYLASQAIFQGLAGIAALIIGYFAVLSIEHLTKRR